MGGNAVSSPQQKFCQELHYLLTKNSYEAPLKEVEDLTKEIAEICPWFPLAGMLDLQKWDKIGYCLREHPRVNFKVRHTWFQVRACLQGPTASNPLLAIKSLPTPLPIILPPLPASWLTEAPKAPKAPQPVSTDTLPACQVLEFPSKQVPEPSPALSTANDGKLFSAGLVGSVPAAALAISPVLQAAAPAHAEKSAPIPSEALKEVKEVYAMDTASSSGAEIVLKAANVAERTAIRQGAKELCAEFVAIEEEWRIFSGMLCISITKHLAFENSHAGGKLAVATLSGSSAISSDSKADYDDGGGGGGTEEVNDLWSRNRDGEKKSRPKQGPSWDGAASVHPPWETHCFPSFRKGISTDTGLIAVLHG